VVAHAVRQTTPRGAPAPLKTHTHFVTKALHKVVLIAGDTGQDGAYVAQLFLDLSECDRTDLGIVGAFEGSLILMERRW
jgi:hypothetical protein